MCAAPGSGMKVNCGANGEMRSQEQDLNQVCVVVRLKPGLTFGTKKKKFRGKSAGGFSEGSERDPGERGKRTAGECH